MKEVSPLSPVMFFIFTLVMSWVKNTMTNSGDYKLVPFMLNRVRSFLGLGTCMQSAPIHGTVSAKSEGTDIVDEFPEKIDK
ncbi:hypothetical protein SK128_010798 [Halocaridina rubra]|uniref:Uncharacterized protein n=1 Tax=Halocaridina rubra TaxID=373956 RepID=A0AAN8WB25_HALRR